MPYSINTLIIAHQLNHENMSLKIRSDFKISREMESQFTYHQRHEMHDIYKNNWATSIILMILLTLKH